MIEEFALITTLTGALTAALLLGYVTQRLRMSPIAGYLLAGVAVGPFTPGFIAHPEIAEQLADVGVILLLFGVGLHFDPARLRAVRAVAIPGAVAQMVLVAALGALVARAAGMDVAPAMVFGLAISIASTVVLTRVLGDSGLLHTPAGDLAIGWLLVEDLLTVLVVVIVPVLAAGGTGARGIALALAAATAKIALLVAFTFVGGRRVIPALMRRVAETGSRELFTLAVLVIALGIAVCSALLFGASLPLGAFLAGLVVGQSELSARAAEDAVSVRDAFAALFFVSIGMLLDPRAIPGNARLTLAAVALVVVAKPTVALLSLLALRRPPRTAATVALALGQIGEFSFILAALARDHGLLSVQATQALVAAAIVSIILNPLLLRLIEPMARLLGRTPLGWRSRAIEES